MKPYLPGVPDSDILRVVVLNPNPPRLASKDSESGWALIRGTSPLPILSDRLLQSLGLRYVETFPLRLAPGQRSSLVPAVHAQFGFPDFAPTSLLHYAIRSDKLRGYGVDAVVSQAFLDTHYHSARN